MLSAKTSGPSLNTSFGEFNDAVTGTNVNSRNVSFIVLKESLGDVTLVEFVVVTVVVIVIERVRLKALY